MQQNHRGITVVVMERSITTYSPGVPAKICPSKSVIVKCKYMYITSRIEYLQKIILMYIVST